MKSETLLWQNYKLLQRIFLPSNSMCELLLYMLSGVIELE